MKKTAFILTAYIIFSPVKADYDFSPTFEVCTFYSSSMSCTCQDFDFALGRYVGKIREVDVTECPIVRGVHKPVFDWFLAPYVSNCEITSQETEKEELQ